MPTVYERKKRQKNYLFIYLLIYRQQNRARRLSLAPGSLIGPEQCNGPSLPNMADVLKGLGKVKLRSVERYVQESSIGGRSLERFRTL